MVPTIAGGYGLDSAHKTGYVTLSISNGIGTQDTYNTGIGR